MQSDGSLTNQLLIAMPGMLDPNFSTTVTLICEHNDDGALGIVINRPTTLKLGGLFEQLSVDDADPGTAANPVLSGGPVGTERGFVLHGSKHAYENTLAVSENICISPPPLANEFVPPSIGLPAAPVLACVNQPADNKNTKPPLIVADGAGNVRVNLALIAIYLVHLREAV